MTLHTYISTVTPVTPVTVPLSTSPLHLITPPLPIIYIMDQVFFCNKSYFTLKTKKTNTKIVSIMISTSKNLFECSNKDTGIKYSQPGGVLVQVFKKEIDLTKEQKKPLPTATYLCTHGFYQVSLNHLYHVCNRLIDNNKQCSH